MATPHSIKPTSALSPQYVTGVYIPLALLLVGVAIAKKEWLPFAAIVAAVLGGYKFYSNRELTQKRFDRWELTKDASLESRKVLKPDVYQHFPLTEKTVLSHNVAM